MHLIDLILAETFEAAVAYEAPLGVDHEGNVWLQDYDCLKLEPFPYLPAMSGRTPARSSSPR